MTNLFDIDRIVDRVNGYVDPMVSRKQLRGESGYVIVDALLRGTISRSEMKRITGLSEKTARSVMDDLYYYRSSEIRFR